MPHARGLETPEAMAESLFFDDPDLSIDTALAIVLDCHPNGLTRRAIEQIQLDVQCSIASAQGLHISKSPSAEETTLGHPTKPVTREEKIAWFAQWLEENYMASIDQARQALIAQFGSGFGTAYIQEKVRAIKERHRRKALEGKELMAARVQERTPKVPDPSEIEQVVRRMKEMGVQKVELFEDGTYSYVLVSGRLKL